MTSKQIDLPYSVEEIVNVLKNYPNKFKHNWIQDHKGNKIDFANIENQAFDFSCVIRGLVHKPRFSGLTKHFWSIGQHSLLVHHYVAQKTDDIEVQLQALLHDFPEGVMVDVPSPLKSMLPFYRYLEDKVATAMGNQFKVDLVNLNPLVKEADFFTLNYEAWRLFDSFAEKWEDHNIGVPQWETSLENVINNGSLVFEPPFKKVAHQIERTMIKLVEQR